LNTQNLQASHDIAPDKFILASEACNCGGVVYRTDPKNWWSRAEDLALDILEDLRFWSVGWTDWNLVLGTDGGPNHLGNLCDANIIVDPQEERGLGKLVVQATYYFMGQFSRFIVPGSRQISVENTVQVPHPEIKPEDVIGRRLPVITCRPGTGAQTFTFDNSAKTLSVYGTCVEPGAIDETAGIGAVELQMASCQEGAANQTWSVQSASSGSRFVHESSGKCLTNVKTHGDAVGMDKGVDVQAAQLLPCDSSNSDQTFKAVQTDSTFAIETPGGLCAQPYDLDKLLFDAVAFQAPDGQVTLVALNVGDEPVTFDLYDAKLGTGTSLEVPSHGIASYVYAPDQSIIV
jgi:glucosylceramidase